MATIAKVYEIPKGHVELDPFNDGQLETLEDAALREFYEETGATQEKSPIKIGVEVGTDEVKTTCGGSKIIHYFVGWCADGGSPVFGEVDSTIAKVPVDSRWISLEELHSVKLKEKG